MFWEELSGFAAGVWAFEDSEVVLRHVLVGVTP